MQDKISEIQFTPDITWDTTVGDVKYIRLESHDGGTMVKTYRFDCTGSEHYNPWSPVEVARWCSLYDWHSIIVRYQSGAMVHHRF